MNVVQPASAGPWPLWRIAKLTIASMLVIGLTYFFFGKSEFLWREIVQMKDPRFEKCKRERALPLYDGYQFAICDVGEQSAEEFTAFIFDSSGQILRPSGLKDHRWIDAIGRYVRTNDSGNPKYLNYFLITQNGYHATVVGKDVYYLRFSRSSREGYENMIVVN